MRLIMMPTRYRHYPQGKATAVSETPESMRLKKQVQRRRPPRAWRVRCLLKLWCHPATPTL